MRKMDFYTAAAPTAFVVGFAWVYVSMTVLQIPGWPAMVAMAAYYAVGGLACHLRCENGSKSVKGLFLGVVLSWIGVAAWATWFKGDAVAMGVVMGAIAMTAVLMTKVRLMGEFQFIAMPQAFLGATIYFGLLNTFMLSGTVPEALFFGWLEPLVVQGKAQPNVAGALALFSAICGVLLGYVHQRVSLWLSAAALSSRREAG